MDHKLMALKNNPKTEDKIFISKNGLLKQLLRSTLPKNQIKILVSFLNLYVRFETEELNIKFEENIQTLTQKNKSSMGLIEQVLDPYQERGLRAR